MVKLCSGAEINFTTSYINAMVYNILSALGGKYITFYVDSANEKLSARLAVKYFSDKRHDLIQEMEQKGFIKYKDTAQGKRIYIDQDKKDMRKPFLEFLMALPDREGGCQAWTMSRT